MATASEVTQSEKLFPEISAEDDSGLTEITSLCVSCEGQGVTKLLFIQIPFYREVILSSFSCPHCGFNNNEIQSAGAIQSKGVVITLAVQSLADLNRQVVRGDAATVKIPQLDFEIPTASQKGTMSTIEGIIQQSIEGLEYQQPIRKAVQPEIAEKLDIFIGKLKELLDGKHPFTLKVDDPSGNSFIENPNAPSADPNLTVTHCVRSLEHDKLLGLQPDDIERPEAGTDHQGNKELDLTNEVLSFPTNCPNCNAPCETNMKVVKIPYFKEVIIMATACEKCGNRSNEVKSGGGFEPTGRKITLSVTSPIDMSRDVLKSETCAVGIPELDLESSGYAISGKFTTVEGLILDLKKTMVDSNPFFVGDSTTSTKLRKVGEELAELAQGKRRFTLILDDPNSNSYVQNIYEPEVDPNLDIQDYERSEEQNEILGLNDMKTENYS